MEQDKFDLVFLSESLVDIRSRLTNLITALDNHSNPELKELARFAEESLEKLASSLLKREKSNDQETFQQVHQIISEDKLDHHPQTGPSTELHEEKPHLDVATFERSHNQDDVARKLVKVEHLDDDAKVVMYKLVISELEELTSQSKEDNSDISQAQSECSSMQLPKRLAWHYGKSDVTIYSNYRPEENIELYLLSDYHSGIISDEPVHHQDTEPKFEIFSRIKELNTTVKKYTTRGQYDLAIRFCEKRRREQEEKSGNGDINVANIIQMLAFIYEKQNDLEMAIKSLEEALHIFIKLPGDFTQSVAATFTSLGLLNAKRRMFVEGLESCKAALVVKENIFAVEHPTMRRGSYNVGVFYQALKRYNDAEEYYKRVLQIDEGDCDEAYVTQAKVNLAYCYRRQGKHSEAIALFMPRSFKLY